MLVRPGKALARLTKVHASFVVHAGLPGAGMKAAAAFNSSVHLKLVMKKLGSELRRP